MVSQLESNSLSGRQAAESARPVSTAQCIEPDFRALIAKLTGSRDRLISPRHYRPKQTPVTERKEPDVHGWITLKIGCAVPRAQECVDDELIGQRLVEPESTEETGNARIMALEQLLHGCAIPARESLDEQMI